MSHPLLTSCNFDRNTNATLCFISNSIIYEETVWNANTSMWRLAIMVRTTSRYSRIIIMKGIKIARWWKMLWSVESFSKASKQTNKQTKQVEVQLNNHLSIKIDILSNCHFPIHIRTIFLRSRSLYSSDIHYGISTHKISPMISPMIPTIVCKLYRMSWTLETSFT